MLDNFINDISPRFFLLVLFAAILAVIVLGFLIGRRIGRPREGADTSALNTALAAILGVVALVLSFSFSFALARYEQRRQLVVQEANDIGTMYLRTAQLGKPAADSLRGLLRVYTQTRINFYGRDENDPGAQALDQEGSDQLQGRMWGMVSNAVRADPRSQGASLLMQVANDVIDTSAEQLSALHYRLRGPALSLVFLVAILGAMAVGLGFGCTDSRNWIVAIMFAVLMTFLVNTIIDLDSPQSGRIRMNLTPLIIQQQSMAPNR
jgi:ABC-type multidrug transport system fused ATPase/permease subunit